MFWSLQKKPLTSPYHRKTRPSTFLKVPVAQAGKPLQLLWKLLKIESCHNARHYMENERPTGRHSWHKAFAGTGMLARLLLSWCCLVLWTMSPSPRGRQSRYFIANPDKMNAVLIKVSAPSSLAEIFLLEAVLDGPRVTICHNISTVHCAVSQAGKSPLCIIPTGNTISIGTSFFPMRYVSIEGWLAKTEAEKETFFLTRFADTCIHLSTFTAVRAVVRKFNYSRCARHMLWE